MPIKTSNDTTITRIYGKTKGKIQTQSKVPPIDFHAKTGLAVEYSINGNMAQASTQEYSITDIPPIDFQSDGSGISAYSIYGNMTQASSQQYSLTGTPPLSFKSDANTLSAWSISGNMTQTGTPTPNTPITPEECGDRTANLTYSNATQTTGTILSISQTIGKSSFILNKAVTESSTSNFVSVDIPLEAGTYTASVAGLNLFSTTYDRIFIRASDDTIIAQNIQTGNPVTFTLSAPTTLTKIVIVTASQSTYNNTEIYFMLNTGQTALPYEPYGYKIPLTANSTTQNTYLTEPIRKIGNYKDIINSDGTVSRVIKKLELTGREQLDGTSTAGVFVIVLTGYLRNSENIVFCTHYKGITPYTASGQVSNFEVALNNVSGGSNYLQIHDNNYSQPTDIIAFFAQQYSSGNPVTVWYILDTPTTEQITAPTIPTTTGDNTLSIGTTLSPSSVSITTTSGVWTENPIIPEEVGERTANLFDISTVEKGRIDNGVVGYASATTDLSVTGNEIEFTTDANYRGVCGGGL